VTASIREAVIVTAPADADRRVAGVPLVLRTILLLQRAGIERVTIDGPVEPPRDPRVRVTVGREPATDARPRLAVGASTVVDATLVQALLDAADRPTWEVGGARAAVEPSLGPATPPPAGVLLPADTPAAVVEHRLLAGLENPRDGYLDRGLHRRFSRPLTRALLPTSITPNQVTVLGVAIGVAGGLLVGSAGIGGVVAGVAALVLSGVLDCVDGEIARMKLTESKLGHVLDVTGDTIVHAALLTGIATRLARTAAWPGTKTLALLAVGVLGAFAAITWSERSETRRHVLGPVWENRVLDGVLSPLTTRDWYVFPVAFALAGRLDVLVQAAAWGAQVFWIAVATLVWRVLRR